MLLISIYNNSALLTVYIYIFPPPTPLHVGTEPRLMVSWKSFTLQTCKLSCMFFEKLILVNQMLHLQYVLGHPSSVIYHRFLTERQSVGGRMVNTEGCLDGMFPSVFHWSGTRYRSITEYSLAI